MMVFQQKIDDEISLIDFLLFLKASVRNVITCSIIFLFIGAAYYFSKPEIYEATAVVQMAVVAGEEVETPAVLLEKIKLPLFFSVPALQACGLDGGLSSHAQFADKLKTKIIKSASFVSLSVQARSSKEAQVCLDAVITDIARRQNELAKPIIDQKKQMIDYLNDQIKIIEDLVKKNRTTKAYNSETEAQHYPRTLLQSYSANYTETSELKRKVKTLEHELIPPQTHPLFSPIPMFVPEVSINKRPIFTLGLSLALGVFLGLLIKAVQRVTPKILRQIHEAEDKSV